jgi:hypothetical protein
VSSAGDKEMQDVASIYVIARTFQLLGLRHLSINYYRIILDRFPNDMSKAFDYIWRDALYNQYIILLEIGEIEKAQFVIDKLNL